MWKYTIEFRQDNISRQIFQLIEVRRFSISVDDQLKEFESVKVIGNGFIYPWREITVFSEVQGMGPDRCSKSRFYQSTHVLQSQNHHNYQIGRKSPVIEVNTLIV